MWKLEASPCEHSRAASARTTARHDTRREQAPFRLPRSSGILSSAESDSALPGTPLLRNWCHHRGGGDTLRSVSGGIEEAAGARPALTTDAAGLLSRASTGDTSALADLFDRFGGLFSACISTVQADPGARDRLCTEVFTAVWRRAREGSRVSEPVLWLLEVLCETLGSTVDSARRPIAREVLALGCPDRELLVLASAGRFSQPEIAALTGIGEPRLRSILRDALQSLRGGLRIA